MQTTVYSLTDQLGHKYLGSELYICLLYENADTSTQGDTLLLECHYTTKDRAGVTLVI